MSRIFYKQYDDNTLKRLQKVLVEIMDDVFAVCDRYEIPCFLVYGTAIGAARHGGFIPWDDDIDLGMLREDYDRFLEVFEKELSDKYELLTPLTDNRYACTVTHVQKKGTVFITEGNQDLKCNRSIFIDIFPFDRLPDEPDRQKKIVRKSKILAKLLFLSGTGNPVIPFDGIIYHILHFVCEMIHFCLKVFHVTPVALYRKFVTNATQYNGEEYEFVTSYEDAQCLKCKVRIDDLFPLKKVKFEDTAAYVPHNNESYLNQIYGDFMEIPPVEKRINHAPIKIDFGEENNNVN